MLEYTDLGGIGIGCNIAVGHPVLQSENGRLHLRMPKSVAYIAVVICCCYLTVSCTSRWLSFHHHKVVCRSQLQVSAVAFSSAYKGVFKLWSSLNNLRSSLNNILTRVIFVRVACGSRITPAPYEKAQASEEICKRAAHPGSKLNQKKSVVLDVPVRVHACMYVGAACHP